MFVASHIGPLSIWHVWEMCPSWSRWQSSKHTLGWRITVDFKESAAQTVLKNRALFVIVVARVAKVLSGMVAHGCRYLIFSFYTTTEAGSFPERCTLARTFKRAVFRDWKWRFCVNGKSKYIRRYTGKCVNEWNLDKREVAVQWIWPSSPQPRMPEITAKHCFIHLFCKV